ASPPTLLSPPPLPAALPIFPPPPIAVSALPRPAATRRVAGLLSAAFASAIFTSAALVFVVEPMFTKMVLPLYGGSAEVWNTCVRSEEHTSELQSRVDLVWRL